MAGRPRRVPGPDPDLTLPGIVLPDSVTEVILLGDGDSDPLTTQCALHRAALRFRAQRADRTVWIAWADDGTDFNDMLVAGGPLGSPGQLEACRRITGRLGITWKPRSS
jgi:hypothetical protein